MNTLVIDSVTLSYGTKTVISGGYMKVAGGHIHALIGRNGYGKSSLMRVMFGTQAAEFSFTSYNGKPLQHPYKVEGLIRYLPQFAFLPRNISLHRFADAYSVPWEKVISCLPSLTGREEQYIGSLSGGENRMLSTVVVICSPVKFVLLDEPFTHIMPLQVDSIKDLIHAEAAGGKGFLITDHLYDHVLDLADSFYYMEWGVTKEISREELLEKDYFLRMK